MLWPDGRVGGAYDTQVQWSQLGTLFKSASQGIVDAYPEQTPPKVVIHLDNGGSQELFSWFFNKLKIENVTFDVIGVSYYPWWHGTLSDLRNNLLYCIAEFGKDIAVVETSYPWTLQWYDNENNIVGLTNQLLPGYTATPNGQAEFLGAVKDIVATLPGNRGLGIVYWAGDWITSNNFSSAWENQALFDNNGNNLPALDVLGSSGPPTTPAPTPSTTPPPTRPPTRPPTPAPTKCGAKGTFCTSNAVCCIRCNTKVKKCT
jgi:arabinogalactan endo-1,4-beta-galactosidase